MAKKENGKGFTLKLENSKIIKVIIETLSSIIDETEFYITPKEFSISAMDPSHICLLKLELSKGDFDEYKCETECKIGLNLDDLDKILKRCGPNDTIILEYAEKDQKLKIKMQADGSRVRTFSLTLLDINLEEIPMENLMKTEFPTHWKMDANILIEALKDAEIYSEILNMKAVEGEGLVFNSTGQIGEMEYELGIDDLVDAEFEETNTGAYSLTFLKSILKISNITETLEISLRTDHPIKLVFNLIEGGILNYFLAPRVQEADFEDDDDLEEY